MAYAIVPAVFVVPRAWGRINCSMQRHGVHGAVGPMGPMPPKRPRRPMGPMGPMPPIGPMGPRGAMEADGPMLPWDPIEPMGPMGPWSPGGRMVGGRRAEHRNISLNKNISQRGKLIDCHRVLNISSMRDSFHLKLQFHI